MNLDTILNKIKSRYVEFSKKRFVRWARENGGYKFVEGTRSIEATFSQSPQRTAYFYFNPPESMKKSGEEHDRYQYLVWRSRFGFSTLYYQHYPEGDNPFYVEKLTNKSRSIAQVFNKAKLRLIQGGKN